MSIRQRINDAISALQAGLAELDNPRKPADDTLVLGGAMADPARDSLMSDDEIAATTWTIAPGNPLAPRRICKPRATGDTLEEVYDALCATPEPQGTIDVARRAHITQKQAKYALSRLRALGRAKSIGSKRGTKYLPLSAPVAEQPPTDVT